MKKKLLNYLSYIKNIIIKLTILIYTILYCYFSGVTIGMGYKSWKDEKDLYELKLIKEVKRSYYNSIY